MRKTCLLLVCSLLFGCAAADGMLEKLYDATEGYNSSLRWGDFDRAAEYLPAASTDRFLDTHENAHSKLVVLDFEMTRLQLNKERGTAAARVEINWHTDDRLIVETTVVDEVWQWHDGRWFLVDERRVRGEKVAVFAEKEAKSAHPYLPGLETFREELGIGLEPAEQRKRAKNRKKTQSEANQSLPTVRRPANLN